MYAQPQPHFPPPQGSYQSGPPPAKKPRGNGPIITRYPPPPGYRGPAQSQPPFGLFGQQPGYGYQQPAYSGYQHQPQYTAYPPQQLPQANCYPQSHPAYPTPVATPQSAPPGTWHQPPSSRGPHRHNSAPSNHLGPVLDGNGDPMPPADMTSDTGHDLEEDFDGECYFARHPEEIEQHLSLGVIQWRPPLPTKRALPSTFQEAELEAIAPRPPPASDEESVSEYFSKTKREESLLSVRQTDIWQDIKESLVFREFSAVCSRIISLSEMLDQYKSRFDEEWANGEDRSPTPSLTRESTPANDGRMEIDAHAPRSSSSQHNNNILDSFEQALRSRSREPSQHRERHSRTNSVCSTTSRHTHTGKITRPIPLPPIHDPTQEDILAALGVTGSPKLVYQTPGPAYGPALSTVKKQQHSRASSVSSASDRLQPTIQPPLKINGYRDGDYDAEPDDQATPRPKLNRFDSSRKRSYADSIAGAIEECDEEDDGATPKPRKKQARVGC